MSLFPFVTYRVRREVDEGPREPLVGVLALLALEDEAARGSHILVGKGRDPDVPYHSLTSKMKRLNWACSRSFDQLIMSCSNEFVAKTSTQASRRLRHNIYTRHRYARTL